MPINYSTKEKRQVSPVYVHNNPYKRVGKANPFFKKVEVAPVLVVFRAV